MVDAVAKTPINYIAFNGLRGGDQLPSERELVEMVGVSQLPLREALCILKGLGIVDSLSRRNLGDDRVAWPGPQKDGSKVAPGVFYSGNVFGGAADVMREKAKGAPRRHRLDFLPGGSRANGKD